MDIFVGSLIYLLSTRVVLYSEVHKMTKCSSNPGKVHFQRLLRWFIYIRDNKNLGLKFYANIEDEPLSDLSIQAIIKTENQLIVFFNSFCQNCTYTGRIIGAYAVFYQGGTKYHCTNFLGPVSQYSADI